MRQIAIVYDGRVDIREYPFVVVKDNLLVKPIHVYIGEIERNLVENKILVEKPVVIGSMGVVRVIEVFGDLTEYTGKVYTVSAMGSRGILGVEENGLLANYSSIDNSYIDEQVIDPSPLDSLRPMIRHCGAIAKFIEEPVLIEGCNLIGLTTGLILRHFDVEPVYYCETRRRSVSTYGFTVYSHIGELEKKWNSIVITSVEINSKYRALSNLEYVNLVVSRISFTNWIPLKKSLRNISIHVVERGDLGEGSYLKQVLGELGKNIKTYSLSDLGALIGLLPPRGLGYVISLVEK